MLNTEKSTREVLIKLPSYVIALFVVFVVLVSLFLVRQRIFDWSKLYGYTPLPAVAQLANDDTMNSYTKHIFYVNHPQIVATVGAFRTYCPEDESDVVLGCYHIGENGIFIYNVADSSLNGVEQVTAAHEVLHVVYARLSSSARNKLDNELQNYYEHGLTDPRVLSEVKLYQKTEPKSVYDEMSCTFGTEIANLPTDLSNYYNQFFTNRQAIVAYEQLYQSAFTSRQNQISSDDSELTSLKQQITSEQQSLGTEVSQLNSQRQALTNLMVTNQAQYNQSIPSFNALVNTYNSGVESMQSNINTYNQLVASRNSIAGAFDTLVNDIDTSIAPQTTK